MSYYRALLKHHFLKTGLILSLFLWAVFATIMALRAENKTILIGIDGVHTRVIASSDDPILNSEAIAFIKTFAALLYNFDPKNFSQQVGGASEFMAQELWKKSEASIRAKQDLVLKHNINFKSKIQKISKKSSGKFQVQLSTTEVRNLVNDIGQVTIDLEIVKIERSESNPWGIEVTSLEEHHDL